MYRQDAHENRSLFLCGFGRKITAYHRANGQVAWVFEEEGAYPYYVDFAIEGGRVYIPSGGFIVCLDYATGARVGRIRVGEGVLRVMIDEGHLFAVGESGIFCLDLAGNVLWRASHELSADSKMPTLGFPGNIIHGFRDTG